MKPKRLMPREKIRPTKLLREKEFWNWQVRLSQQYNITYGRWLEMYRKQDGLCAICRGKETRKDPRTRELLRLSVDHDHACCSGSKSCGKCVRSLLCSRCNGGIAAFRDSPYLLLTAADYLKKHGKEPRVGWKEIDFIYQREKRVEEKEEAVN